MPKYRPIPALTKEEIDRFWSNVAIGGPDECWEWFGSRYKKSGHGAFNLSGGGQVVASRISYYLATNHDPGKQLVCHTCDNPPCMNPKHFFLGTQADNMHDCHIKGRTASGENHGRHKVTFNQVTEIRASNGTCNGTCKATGRKFGISAAETCNIRNYKNWIT